VLSGIKWDTSLIQYIGEILDQISGWENRGIIGLSMHKRNGQAFRAHPNYRGDGPWYDWVMIDWGKKYGIQPGHIRTFLDLSELPEGSKIKLPDAPCLTEPGTYAVVEAAMPVTDPIEIGRSQFLIPYNKMYNSLAPLERKYFLVDVESFVAPVCMVPDMGGRQDGYFRMLPRSEWLELYKKWIRAPHEKVNEILGAK
jgi:hypothetical protein